MGVKDEVTQILTSGPRIEEGGSAEPGADIANLRAAVSELQRIVVLLAEEIDTRDECTG